jgi:hypothetical protein
MDRKIEPEILESLPPDNPAAVVGRANLRLINTVMGNHRWIVRQVQQHIRTGWRILELGAGDGMLAQHLLRKGVCRADAIWGLDLVARPENWPVGSHWIQGDITVLPKLPEAEILICNLILHHLDEEQLRRFGERLPAAGQVLLANEPARQPIHLFQARLLSLVARLNYVTRHDILVSIKAGFRDRELVRSLDMAGDWCAEIHDTFRGAHRIVARRLPNLAQSEIPCDSREPSPHPVE